MKNFYSVFLSVLLLSLTSCSNKAGNGSPDVNFEELEKDFVKWISYHNDNINLSSDFIPVDCSSKLISKADFLKMLTTGEFIPLKLKSKESTICYKLFKLDKSADISIVNTIKSTTFVEYRNFEMEGRDFPDFSFRDMDGNEYNNENTKGKIIILKCWFINCPPCIAEFPELNAFAERYRNRKDIIFISLALDTKPALEKFLSENRFDYIVIPDQKEFIGNILNINEFPTHFIIGKNGVIKKVVNKADEMILAFDREELSKQ